MMTLPKDRAEATALNDAERTRHMLLIICTTVPRNQWLTCAAKLTAAQQDAMVRELDGLVPDLAALREVISFRDHPSNAPGFAATAYRCVRKLLSYTAEPQKDVRNWFTPRSDTAPTVACPDCGGEGGEFDREGAHDCARCGGTGEVFA